jgi:putative Mg2+ transporter-C (MgtC) family protein
MTTTTSQPKPQGGDTPKPGQERDRPDRAHEEEMIDEAVEESFPASDPPAAGGTTGAGRPKTAPDQH